jgi:CubicO group peptidase (beta-lactamase class C family)
MKKIVLIFSLFWILASSFAQNLNTIRLDSIMQAYTNQNMFSGNILVYQKGKKVFSKSYGYADVEKKILNTEQTPFCLASVSKQFTAMAIAILVEQNKLKLEDKLTKFIPDYPNGDKITVHQLLTHTSGIHNFTDDKEYDGIKTKEMSLKETIEMFKNKPLDFESGSKFSYSNSGYILLSYIIEVASKKSLSDFLKKEIFNKLGMKNSGYYPKTNQIPKNAAQGYSLNSQDQYEKALFVPRSIPAGAGGLYSTTEDMLKWHEALNTEKLVKKEMLTKIFTPEKDNYAYGWMIRKQPVSVQMHTGGIEGFSTVIARLPEENSCLIVLRNCDNQNLFNPYRIAFNMMINKPYNLPKIRKPITISPEKRKEYEGEYSASPDFSIKIFVENGKIMTQATNQEVIEIFAESEDNFFLKVVDAQIKFEREGNAIKRLILFQNGAKMPMEKK